MGLAYTGQYVVPALRPIAVAGMTLYSLPNVVNGAKRLARGEVGLYALYSTGLVFMLVSGMVFNQIGGMLALGNGLLPLRKASAVRASKERRVALT